MAVPSMTPPLLGRLFSFRARVTGTELFAGLVFVAVLRAVLGAAVGLIDPALNEAVNRAASLLLLPAVVGRLHDAGDRGWIAGTIYVGAVAAGLAELFFSTGQMLPFVLVGAVPTIWLIWRLVQAGHFGPNAYGPDPRLGPEQFEPPQPSVGFAV